MEIGEAELQLRREIAATELATKKVELCLKQRELEGRARYSSAARLSIITALIGVLGLILGGVTQYFVSSAAAKDERQLKFKVGAYEEYAAGQAALQRAKSDKEVETANRQIRASAFKIVMFGDPTTVKALATFIHDAKSRKRCTLEPSDIAVYQSMRREALGLPPVSDADVAMALFGCVLSQ
jgi:hypothetical protein